MSTEADYLAYFSSLIDRYVPSARKLGSNEIALCIFHEEKTPSLSINRKRGVFFCHGCGVGEGFKRFAELVGEPWAVNSLTRREKALAAVAIRRRDAERRALAVLQRRRDERLDEIFDEWRAVNLEATSAAELLRCFYRWPGLEAEFPDLAAQAGRDHGAAVSRRVFLEAQMWGEVV